MVQEWRELDFDFGNNESIYGFKIYISVITHYKAFCLVKLLMLGLVCHARGSTFEAYLAI